MQSDPVRLRPSYYALALVLILTPPAIAATAALSTVVLLRTRSSVYRQLAQPILALTIAASLAFIASFVFGADPGDAARSTKFLLMAVCLLAGSWAGVGEGEVRRLALLLSGVVVGWYLLTFVGLLPDQRSVVYPPAFNNAVILVFLLSFIIANGRGLVFRLVMIGGLLSFSQITESRLLVVLAPLFFLSQPISLSGRKVLSLMTVAFAGVAWVWSSGAPMSWSDVVRIELYKAAWAYFRDGNATLIASGQPEFVRALNDALPLFIAERLEVVHAHNAYVQILGSYGGLALAAFVSSLLAILQVARLGGDETLRNMVLMLAALMMIEPVISDSRTMYVIFLILGMQCGISLRERSWLDPPPTSPHAPS